MPIAESIRKWWLEKLTFRDKLLIAIGALAISWYFVCIVCAGCTDVDGDAISKDMRQFMSVSITTISGTLATYIGMLLGFGSALRRGGGDAQPSEQAAAVPQITRMQAVAAVAYVVSLVVALGIWLATDEKNLDPAVINLGRSILGLFGGVLAVILNVPDQK
jgi:hypothetical protein